MTGNIRRCLCFVFLSVFVSACAGVNGGKNIEHDVVQKKAVYDDYVVEKTATDDDIEAWYEKGNQYFELEDIDFKQSIFWYRKAAKQGHAEAQYKLSRALGATKNPESHLNVKEASFWRNEAANNGVVDAINSLCLLDHTAWCVRAAENGDKHAQFDLAEFYYNGSEGFTKNIHKAVHWYTLSADQGHPIAQYKLGYIYSGNDSDWFDSQTSIYWYTKAAKNNSGSVFKQIAQQELAVIYYIGKGVVQDFDKAAAFAKQPAEQGYLLSQYLLALMYAYGDGVERDLIEAYALASAYIANGSNTKHFDDILSLRSKIAANLSSDEIRKANGIANKYFKVM